MNIAFYKESMGEEELNTLKNALNFEENQALILEKWLQEYTNAKYAITVNTPTAAMHLALCAMDLKRGDKIICSVNSFPAVAEVVRHFDAEPIFVDIEKDTYNIDVKKFEQVLKKQYHKKLKAAFIGHVGGLSANLNEIYELGEKYDIKIIDDGFTNLGTTYNQRKVSSLKSFISCFHLSPEHCAKENLGGAFVTNDEEIAKRAMLLRDHAIVKSEKTSFAQLDYVYDVTDIGVKYDISDFNAAFALEQLKKIDTFNKRRIEIAKKYHEELKNCPHVSLPGIQDEHIFTKFIIKIDKNRDNFARNLKQQGINTALHYAPLHLLSYYKSKYNLKIIDFSVALSNYQQILSLPIYASLSDKEVNYICQNIRKVALER